MLTLLTSAAVGAFVGVTSTTGQMLRAKTFEGRLAIARRVLWIVGAALVVLAIGIAIGPAVPRVGVADAARPEAVQEALRHAREADRHLRVGLVAAVFVVALLVPTLVLVLRPLGAFVLEHRLDLAARQQIEQQGRGRAG